MEMNPFARPDGGPIPEKITQFMEWNQKAWEKHLETLSPEQRELEMSMRRNVSRRMQSEVGVS